MKTIWFEIDLVMRHNIYFHDRKILLRTFFKIGFYYVFVNILKCMVVTYTFLHRLDTSIGLMIFGYIFTASEVLRGVAAPRWRP